MQDNTKTLMLISYWNNPIQSAGSNRVNSFIKYLQEEGWRIILVTVNHNNGMLVNRQGLHFEKTHLSCAKRYMLDGVSPDVIFKKNFCRNTLNIKEHNPTVKKPSTKAKIINAIAIKLQQTLLLPDGLFWGWYLPNRKKILAIYDKEQPDIVLTSAMPVACHYFGRKLAIKRNAKWIADFRDLYADNLLESGRLFTTIKKRIQQKLIKPAEALTTVSHGLKEELILQSKKRVNVIYNGYEKNTLKPPLPKENIGHQTFGLYLGTLYASQYRAFTVFLHFISQFKPDKPFYFIGNVEKPDKLDMLIKQSHYPIDPKQFVFQPYLPKEALHTYESGTEYFLHFDFDTDGNLSSKIFHYLSSTKPLLFFTKNKKTELSRIVSTAGHHVISDEELDSATYLHFTETTPNLDYIETFDRKHQAQLMSRLLKELTV